MYILGREKGERKSVFAAKLHFSASVHSGNVIPAELWLAGSICKFFSACSFVS